MSARMVTFVVVIEDPDDDADAVDQARQSIRDDRYEPVRVGPVEPVPHVEVVAVRDPDSATDLRVFVNGVDVTDEASIFHVDPGAGYTLSDWRETTEHDVKAASPAAGEFIREQRDGCENSHYLLPDDEPEPAPVTRSTVHSTRVGSEYDVERRGGLVAVTDDYGRQFVENTLDEAVRLADEENLRQWRCAHCRTKYDNSDDPAALTPCPERTGAATCTPVA